jgi:hypothetical protein
MHIYLALWFQDKITKNSVSSLKTNLVIYHSIVFLDLPFGFKKGSRLWILENLLGDANHLELALKIHSPSIPQQCAGNHLVVE